MIKIKDMVGFETSDPYDMNYAGTGIVTEASESEITIELTNKIEFNNGYISEIRLKPRRLGDNIYDVKYDRLNAMPVNAMGRIDPVTSGQHRGYQFITGCVYKL